MSLFCEQNGGVTDTPTNCDERNADIVSRFVAINSGYANTVDYVTADTALLAEHEFKLVKAMDGCLIIYHPYRTLEQVQQILKLTPREMQRAWYEGEQTLAYLTGRLGLL